MPPLEAASDSEVDATTFGLGISEARRHPVHVLGSTLRKLLWDLAFYTSMMPNSTSPEFKASKKNFSDHTWKKRPSTFRTDARMFRSQLRATANRRKCGRS